MTEETKLDFNAIKKQTLIPHGEEVEAKVFVVRHNSNNNPYKSFFVCEGRLRKDTYYLSLVFKVLTEKYRDKTINYTLVFFSKDDPFLEQGAKKIIKKIIDSHYGLDPEDTSEKALSLRRLKSFGDLHGMQCAIKVSVKEESPSVFKNSIAEFLPRTKKDLT